MNNLLILDIENEPVIQKLKDIKGIKVVTGTIRRPKLYPIPDLILINFDMLLGYVRRECIFIEIASKLHPQVDIIAFADYWTSDKEMLAHSFGADDCMSFSELENLPQMIKYIFDVDNS